MASKLSRNILQSAALSGVNPSTGQYLSSSQRKAIFRRSKISSANVFARSSSDLVAANSSAIVKYQDKSLSAKLDKVISYFERREREDKKIKKRELFESDIEKYCSEIDQFSMFDIGRLQKEKIEKIPIPNIVF